MAYEQRHVEHVHEHSGMSAGVVAVLVILAAAVVGLAVFMAMRWNNANNANVATQQPATTVQQPAAQPPQVTVQERGAAPATTTNRTVVVHAPDDAAVQAEVDRRIANAVALSGLGITTTVSNGRIVLVGHVNNNSLRSQAERLARSVNGVKTVDNQIVIVTRQP